MVFSSPLFLFIFFPLFFSIYYFSNNSIKNYVILAGSLIFYAWGAPKFIFLLILFSFIDYIMSLLIERFRDYNRSVKWIVSISVCMNLSLLVYFKYANLVVSEFNNFIQKFGFHVLPWTTIALPLGISFFVFHKLSYILDVYWGRNKPARSFPDFLVYITLFPQLIAGPIIRYHDIARQIVTRNHNLETFFEGMYRFSIGLGKKTLIANLMGEMSDKLFAVPPSSLPVLLVWFGITCYSFQIYFDFAGYSDMAIGLGKMMGFHFRENFDMPYISKSITEFWRRWHISLSLWMKEYLYIPMGGNRVSKFRQYLNLWVVFGISGIWHGANWTFGLWGMYHGLFLILDKLLWGKWMANRSSILRIATTYCIILFGWVLFRSPSVTFACKYSLRMLGIISYKNPVNPIIWQDFISHRGFFVFGVAALISFFPATSWYNNIQIAFFSVKNDIIRYSMQYSFIMFITILSIVALSNASFNPFIYFRF